ncbi:MAG: gamma-butyrobetaine hydroxylase-like domain-containing protein [Burkholderiales bacterium]|nr:gamma-butyrobetaine hydroxylase-like domain-containing protein [Burkholderiales bacterium]
MSDTEIAVRPRAYVNDPAGKSLTLTYASGMIAVLPHSFLRVYSPMVKLPITDEEMLSAESASIVDIEEIGDDGILLTFADGLRGLCLWTYFFELAKRHQVLVPIFLKQLAAIKEKKNG